MKFLRLLRILILLLCVSLGIAILSLSLFVEMSLVSAAFKS